MGALLGVLGIVGVVAVVRGLRPASTDRGLDRPLEAEGAAVDEDLVRDPGPGVRAADVEGAEAEPDAPPTEAAPRDFEAIYADLVGVFLVAQVSGAAGIEYDADSLNAKASDLFLELARSEVAAGPPTLRRIDGLAPPWEGDQPRAEALVCHLILDFELQQMTRGGHRAEQRGTLVADLLDRLPLSADHARFVVGLLADRPYLGAEHESTLVGMATIAHGELQYMAEPVRALLVTVWTNLGTDRVTSVEDLLRAFDDPEAGVLGLAAQQQLMLSDAYRDLVVQYLVQRGDMQMMTDMARFAATSLPPEAAIEVTATLKEAEPQAHFGGAYLALVERSPQALEASYRDSLALGSQPGHREQAALALANYSESGGVEFAREVFDTDPGTRVRGVALLALGSNAGGGEFQECYRRAAADEAFRDPRHASYLVSALENHARRADPAFLDSATAELLAVEGLPPHSVERLEVLRTKYLE